MKKSVIIMFMYCVAVIGIAATSWAAEQEKPRTLEQKAWDEVDSLDKESLQDFLARFPDGGLAKQAKVAIELQDKFTKIKEGKPESAFTVSLDLLGDTWKGWQKRNSSTSKGVIGYFTKKGGKYNTLGWFRPDPLSGGKTPGSNTVSFDSRGLMTSPTGGGSIIAFRTDGLKFELFNGIVFQTPGNEPMYFGVLEGKGIVHLKGEGAVTFPDGTTKKLKGSKEIIFPDFKPTLSGHKNNAFVQTDKVGADKKEMVVFWRKDRPEYVLVAALGGAFWGGGFQIGANGEKKCNGEAHVAIDGESQFTGNLDYDGSTYTFLGKASLLKYTFESSENDPLVLKLVKDKGFVYVKGEGTVTKPDGDKIDLGLREQRNYNHFSKWDLSFDYPKEWQEHPADRVAMMKEYLERELRPYGRHLQEFAMIVGPNDETALRVSKYTIPKTMKPSEFVEERKQVYNDAKRSGDVTKVNHVKETTIAKLPAVAEDVERSNGGRGRTFKVIDGTNVFEISFVANNAGQFLKYSTVLDHLVSSIKLAGKTERPQNPGGQK